MKAISLLQPWATLVAIGAKHIETRSWSTPYRGPLAIHASAGKQFINMRGKDYICGDEPFCEVLNAAATGHAATWHDLKDAVGRPFMPRGAVVAICQLVNVIEIPEKRRAYPTWSNFYLPPDEPERSFGDYAPGRFAWVLEKVKPLAKPIPAKGSLGLWEWKGEA